MGLLALDLGDGCQQPVRRLAALIDLPAEHDEGGALNSACFLDEDLLIPDRLESRVLDMESALRSENTVKRTASRNIGSGHRPPGILLCTCTRSE